MRMGDRIPYRNPASDIWHAALVVGVRRTPNESDGRKFARLEMDCGGEDVEAIVAVLDLTAKARIAEPAHLCTGCYRRGAVVDGVPSPDRAMGIDSWREALERQGNGVWFCPACRSHAATLSTVCPNCGGNTLVAAPPRHLRDAEADEVVG